MGSEMCIRDSSRTDHHSTRLKSNFSFGTLYKLRPLIMPGKWAHHVMFTMSSSHSPIYSTLSFRLGFRKLSLLSTSIKTFHGFRLVPFLPPAAIFPPLSFARLKWQWSFCFWSEDRAALSAFQPLEVLPASMDRNRRACPCSTFPLMKRLTVLPNSNSEKTNRIYS